MRSAGLESRVLRVGQLVGDSKVGEWNITEGIPLMIQTAETLGSLPALDEEMSWLPVDYAASIILDIVQVMDPNTGNQPYQSNPETGAEIVYHVLNPVRFHWTRQMLPALRTSGLKFKTLSTDQWMELLRASPRDPKRNPPIKLLDWFESKYGCKANPNNRGGLVYLTEKTKKVSRTVECVLDVTSVEFVKKIVKRLRIHWGNDKSEA
jgi:thioester reductase-like protein